MLAARQAAKGLSEENVNLSKSSVTTEGEITKLSDTLKTKLAATSQTTRADVEKMRGTLEQAGFSGAILKSRMDGLFTTLAKPRVLADLRQGFIDAGLGIREADKAASTMAADVVKGFASLAEPVQEGEKFFASLASNVQQATTGLAAFAGGIPVIGGPLAGLVATMGGLGPIGFGVLIPMLAALAAGLAILAVNIGSVILALGAMIATFIAATFVMTVFGAALFGVLGMLVLAAAPIVLLTVALDAMGASQAKAAASATAGLQSATQAYQSAQQALRAANASTAVPTAQGALNAANQQLGMAQHNAALLPGSIGAQGALNQAQIAQQSAASNLHNAQLTQAQQIAAAQQNMTNAAQKLALAQQAVAQSNQGVVDAFAKLDQAFQKVQQSWVNAAAPVMAQIAAALIGILPTIRDLGLEVVHWFSGEIPQVIKAAAPTFQVVVDLLTKAGHVFADFFQQALQRTPALNGVFREFGLRMVDAFAGVLTNLLRLSDWFTSNLPTLQPIIEEILGGAGRAVQGFFDQTAKFIEYVVANWPTIGPVFEQTITSIIGFFGGLWQNFGALIVWLDQTFPTAQKNASRFLEQLGNDIQNIGRVLDITGKVIQGVEGVWIGFWVNIQPIFAAFQKGFGDSFGQVLPVIRGMAGPLQAIANQLRHDLGGGNGQGIVSLLAQFAYWLGRLAATDLGGIIVTLETLGVVIGAVADALVNLARAIGSIHLPGGGSVGGSGFFQGLLSSIVASLIPGSGFIPGHADGGVVGGSGFGDNTLIRATPGEGVLTTSTMKRIGGAAGLNALNSGGGLSDGGRLAAIEGHLAALVDKALGTVNVSAVAIDYTSLAREITKAQRFAAASGKL